MMPVAVLITGVPRMPRGLTLPQPKRGSDSNIGAPKFAGCAQVGMPVVASSE